MAFIDAGISSYYSLTYRRINEEKKEIMSLDERHLYIDTIAADISRNQDNMDRTHYDAIGEIKLGHLFAKGIINIKNTQISFDEFRSFNETKEWIDSNSDVVINAVNQGKLSFLFGGESCF